MSDKAKVTLKSETRAGIKRPVVHVLFSSGRTDEFKGRAILIPEGDAFADGVFAFLVNGKGEPLFTPDGEHAVIAVPVVALDGVVPNPDKWLDWKAVAELVGVSLSTVKRMVADGDLPQPVKRNEGGRKVGFRQGEVVLAVEKRSGKAST
jgi:predicted DNA-binding transcriptional regulator AlpA